MSQSTVLPNHKIAQSDESIKVIILSEDGRQADRFKEALSSITQDVQVIGTLKEFWQQTINGLDCDLLIVDVLQMSDERLVLANHPFIRSGRVGLCFFYQVKSQALLYSTYEIDNIGLINASQSLRGQIKLALSRLNRINHLAGEVNELLQVQSRDRQSLKKALNENTELKQQNFYRQLLRKILAKFKDSWQSIDYHDDLCRLVNQVNFVEKFLLYEVAANGQKLISPNYSYEKYDRAPSLWLESADQKGANLIAQNQASQVVLDLWGGCFTQISFYGSSTKPKMLLFLKVDEEYIQSFPWLDFEKSLNTSYALNLLKQASLETSFERRLNTFEFLGLMQKKAQSIESRLNYLKVLDFSMLFDTISDQQSMFSWTNFAREFFAELEKKMDFSYQYTFASARSVFFLVSEEDSEQFEKIIKNFSAKFPFWRYFESSEQMVLTHLKPTLQSLPCSIQAYTKYLDKIGSTPKMTSQQKANKFRTSATRPRPSATVN